MEVRSDIHAARRKIPTNFDDTPSTRSQLTAEWITIKSGSLVMLHAEMNNNFANSLTLLWSNRSWTLRCSGGFKILKMIPRQNKTLEHSRDQHAEDTSLRHFSFTDTEYTRALYYNIGLILNTLWQI